MNVLLCLVLFFALTSYSSATYCICKDGLSPQVLQKNLDYACGAGADCSPLAQNGPCFQPNTVKDHCDYAVNSYFQRKGQVQGSCDFAGTAIPTQTLPAVASGCVYPSSPSNTGSPTTTTPSTTPSTTTPSGTPPSTVTPVTTPPTTITPGTTPPTTITPGITPTTTTPGITPTTTTPGTSPSVFGAGISPTGSGSSFDGSATMAITPCTTLFYTSALTLCFSVLLIWG